MTKLKVGTFAAICFMLAFVPLTVGAATPGSVYSYTLDGSSSSVPNNGSLYPNTPLTLEGEWSPSTSGVHFTDSDTNNQPTTAVGYAKPASGSVFTSNDGFGAGIAFVYNEGTGGCLNDSRNILQLGRYGNGLSQLKLQLKQCSSSNPTTSVQCRVAGANSATTVPLTTNTMQLVDGTSYIAKCEKAPDTNGNSIVTVSVKDIAANAAVATTQSIPAIGTFDVNGSNAYLSVANKYGGPSTSDQFVGDIAKVAVCEATTAGEVSDCLTSEVGSTEEDSVPQPTFTEWVTNQSVETDLTGWEGQWGDTSLSEVTRTYSYAHSGNYSIKVLALAGAQNRALGFKDGWTPTVDATTAGTEYRGSVWVKPDYDGQKINMKLREFADNWQVVNSNREHIIASGTDWQLLESNLTATADGNTIGVGIYADGMDAGDTFFADDMSVESGEQAPVDTPAPGATQWLTNQSVEAELNGWTGKWGQKSAVDVTRSNVTAYDGDWSVLVTANSTASSQTLGFKDTTSQPSVDGTELGTEYNASVWVKPGYVGQQISLKVREFTPAVSLVDDNKATISATSTNWQEVTVKYTAVDDGNDLRFSVYADGMSSGDVFYADAMSLTSS